MKPTCRLLSALFLLWSFVLAAAPLALPEKGRTALNEKSLFDLGPQKPGKFLSGKVEFRFSADADAQKCGGLIIGKEKVRLAVAPAAKEGTLYLLHAVRKSPKAGTGIGKVTVFTKDGKSTVYPVRSGTEVMDFFSGRGGKNAVRVFSIYNGATQISLFATALDCKGEVTAIELEGSQTPWCVAALSIAPKAKLAPIYPQMRAVKKHAPVPPVSADVLAKVAAAEKTPVRNVIFIVGDGMGFGAREFTSRLLLGKPGALQAEQLPVRTQATTFSASSKVTDSAASGTALAGGYKTNNGMLGMMPDGKKLHSIAAMVKKAGYAVGIVTTDAITGATPSAYFAHVPKRKMAQEIVDDLAVCNYDVLIGNSAKNGFTGRTDKKDMLDVFAAQKYSFVKKIPELARIPADRRVLGLLSWKTPEDLGEVTAFTLKRLNACRKGFFVMIECSWPDGGGHGNNPDLTVDGVLGTEAALTASLRFAAENPGTLIIVTADHETGGITVIPAKGTEPVMVRYSTTSHTGTPVPVFAAGSGCRALPQQLDNTGFAKIFAGFYNVKLMQPAE